MCCEKPVEESDKIASVSLAERLKDYNNQDKMGNNPTTETMIEKLQMDLLSLFVQGPKIFGRIRI